jgi:hypothetical protein
VIGTTERSISPDHVTVDVEIIDGAGQLVQRWESLTFRRVDGSDFDGPWPLPLLQVYFEHAAKNFLGTEGEHSPLEGDGAAGGRHLSAVAADVTTTILPVCKDAVNGSLENSEGLRCLLQRVRFGLKGEQLASIVAEDLMTEQGRAATRRLDGVGAGRRRRRVRASPVCSSSTPAKPRLSHVRTGQGDPVPSSNDNKNYFETRFVTPADTNVVGNVFVNVLWQGKCGNCSCTSSERRGVEAGHALVPSTSSCRYVEQLRALDTIVIRMNVDCPTRMLMSFHYYRLNVGPFSCAVTKVWRACDMWTDSSSRSVPASMFARSAGQLAA